LTPAVQQGNFGKRAAFGSVRDQGCRIVLLAGIPAALLFTLLDTSLLPKTNFGNTPVANHRMNFKTATDRLSAAKITADDIADACGVVRNTIARARLNPSSPAYRSPPENWQEVLARLARERAEELVALADELSGVR
jgi:hypothetical protein